jgi:hypothetical protein
MTWDHRFPDDRWSDASRLRRIEPSSTLASMNPILGPAVELIARFGDAERTRALHAPDGNQRCRTCTTPGYGTPYAPWPCLLHVVATLAIKG